MQNIPYFSVFYNDFLKVGSSQSRTQAHLVLVERQKRERIRESYRKPDRVFFIKISEKCSVTGCISTEFHKSIHIFFIFQHLYKIAEIIPKRSGVIRSAPRGCIPESLRSLRNHSGGIRSDSQTRDVVLRITPITPESLRRDPE